MHPAKHFIVFCCQNIRFLILFHHKKPFLTTSNVRRTAYGGLCDYNAELRCMISCWQTKSAPVRGVRPLRQLGIRSSYTHRDPGDGLGALTYPFASGSWIRAFGYVFLYYLRAQVADATLGPFRPFASVVFSIDWFKRTCFFAFVYFGPF